MSLVMTDEEICALYRESRFKAKQIGILAELNCTCREQIVNILTENGFEIKRKKSVKRPTAESVNLRKKELAEMAAAGMSVKEAAQALGMSYSTCYAFVQYHGILFDRRNHGKQKRTQ